MCGGREAMWAASLTALLPRTVQAKKKQLERQQLDKFGTGKSKYKESYLEGSEERTNPRNEIPLREKEKIVHLSSAEVAGTSRFSRTIPRRVGITMPQKWYYRRGLQTSETHTTEMIPGVT